MKKVYREPIVKKIDFEYNEQVVAQSEIGIQARPTHPTDCQYSTTKVPTCMQIYEQSDGCYMNPWSLRPVI